MINKISTAIIAVLKLSLSVLKKYVIIAILEDSIVK